MGDRLRTDAIGAAAAGLTGVWLDRTAAGAGGGAGGSGAGAGADAAEAARLGIIRITSLAALPGALAARSLAPLTAGPR
ncbi:hypothetical protein [Cryobacterium sp. TMT2-17-1]|uniref:hypothetical protein n=1 Tax=Cryobacterium sp. TMT2-17-1 TaxID=1259248 RepID=UPI001F546F0C|nr:hypothetical protein [Cryobacterium sp. TMT2-17-1]